MKVLKEDANRISRYYFQSSRPDDATLDIATVLIEDHTGYETINQCDDAQNFVNSNAETYFQRVCFILGCCRLNTNPDVLHEAVWNLFVEQATDSKPGDHGPDEPKEVNEAFTKRMMNAIRHDKFIGEVVEYIKNYYLKMTSASWQLENREVLKNRMMLLRGYRIDCENCGKEPIIPDLTRHEPEEEETEAPVPQVTGNASTGLIPIKPKTLKDEDEDYDPLVEKYSNYDILEGVEEEKKGLWQRILRL